MRTLFSGLALALAAVGAHAQAVNKCVVDGQVTYQPTPCSAGAAATPIVKGPAPPPSGREITEADIHVCRTMLLESLKDPDSAKFKGEPLNVGVIPRGEGRAQAVAFEVNAKNSYGGYTGFKTTVCYVGSRPGEYLGLKQLGG